MTEYLTEQEQIEQLKKWFWIYGVPAVLGIVVGIAIFYGWNYYQSYHTQVLSNGSKIYDEMLTDRAQNNANGALDQANKLIKNFPGTPYGEMAALMLARDAANQKNYPEALKKYSWVRDHSKTNSIREIARLRIARVYIAQQKPDLAINELKKVDDAAFNGLIDEIRGDAYLTMHRTPEAREAYQHALQELPNAEEIRPLLEMKLDNLDSTG